MPLSAGDKLGPYDVIAAIGAGGMGEVYKALDTRLDRTVAIKVLPEHIAKRDDMRARFEREARAVASLNHPNICTLYDIGPGYMVMELIEGESLAARIEKGALPLDQALQFGTQIADALDRAHRAGVTHRDVKPQNIMITRDGVKVLDFGLAKSVAKPGPTEETLTAVLTSEGTIMGTPQYMAPEQFEGKEANARSDIWAFGAVLYEMVTGRKAFEGKSYSSLLGAILSADPAPMAVQPFTPSWLDRLVRRCLQKDPEDRYFAMRDIVLDLRQPPTETSATLAKPGRWWQTATAAAILVTIVFAGLWLRKAAPAPFRVTMEINPPAGNRFIANGNVSISPDGRMLTMSANSDDGKRVLYLRPLASLAARALTTLQANDIRPFWSPDNRSLAFYNQGRLKRMDLAGGALMDLCDAGNSFRGGDWNEDGVILFSTIGLEGIQRVPSSGGAPAPVTRVNKVAGEISHFYPQFLPGGREYFYLVINSDPNKSGIAVGSLDGKSGESGPASIVAATEYSARYDAASSLLLSIQRAGTLMARRLELNPMRLVGDPLVVAEGVRTEPFNGFAAFALSKQGTLFYERGDQSRRVRFGWRDRLGKVLETIGEPFDSFGGFDLSPDGTRVTYSVGTDFNHTDVWVMNLARGLSTRISFNYGTSPKWSPDGKSVYYNNRIGIVRRQADGSGDEVLLAKAGPSDYVSAVSPDGKALLFGFGDIMKLPLAAEGSGAAKPEPYLMRGADYRNLSPVFSPDGRWFAYHSGESGRNEVYIQGYPDKRAKTQVSASGGANPAWRQDGRELYWVGRDRTLMSAGIELRREDVRLGRLEPLLQDRDTSRPFLDFQPSPDGQRFLVYEPVSADRERKPFVVVQNWAAGLGKEP